MGNFEFEVVLPYVRGEKPKRRSTTHSDTKGSM